MITTLFKAFLVHSGLLGILVRLGGILRLKKLQDEARLLHEGYRSPMAHAVLADAHRRRIAYALNNSLPHTSNGYAIRSQYIAASAQAAGYRVYAVTRLGFPWDSGVTGDIAQSETVDNVTYHRLDAPGFRLGETTHSAYIDRYAAALAAFARTRRVGLLHGASDFLTGLATTSAARALGIPSVYEVRGFWEITRASREPWFARSVSYKMHEKLETQACRDATTVIALCEPVKEELVARGVDATKIEVVPHGVDTAARAPQHKDAALLGKLGWEGACVVGFVGSVVDYEGLETLLLAAKRLQPRTDGPRYLIVGDGDALRGLQATARTLGLEALVHFAGRVPHRAVAAYYSIMDVACYPRRDREVCRIVSPAKPFEAMAYGIPVVASSVRAHRCFIQPGKNGLVVPPDDAAALAHTLLHLTEHPEERARIAAEARAWVVAHGDASVTAARMHAVYETTYARFAEKADA